MVLVAIALIPIFLCWGSFLNVVAYRLIHARSLIAPRSYCPACKHTLAWFDLIPVLSWIALKARCRYCKKSISWLYPLIEIITAVAMFLLVVYSPIHYFFSYFIFFSALIITIRTDLQTMLISRYVSLFLVPLGFLLSALKFLPITLFESILGAAIGYALLFIIEKLFYLTTKKEGMGQGDIDLLSFIGSFVGVFGCWATLLLASFIGSIVGITYIIIIKPGNYCKIPFGPFLALGSMIYVLFKEQLFSFYF